MRKITYFITILLLILTLAAAALLWRSGKFDLLREPEPAPTAVPAETALPSRPPVPTATPTPTPIPTPDPTPDYLTLSFIGDCTLASSQHHKGNAYAFEKLTGEDYAYPFAETVQYFENDYLSFANMEGTFTTSSADSGGTFVFKSDPAYAQVFAEGGIDFVTLANNHAGDFLQQGREDTKAALDAAGVEYAGDDEWYLCRREDGPTVGVYCALYPDVYGADKVAAGVKALKEAGAELIICALHWGIEGSYQVTAGQTQVAHAAIDAGADIIWGSHPHVLQRTEEYNGKYIFYSLGNWSFGGNTAPRDRDTAIIQVTVKRDIDGTLSLEGFTCNPCALSGHETYNDYQPCPLEAGTAEYARTMSKLDGSWKGTDLSIDYSAFHDKDESAAADGEDDTAENGEAPAAAEESTGGGTVASIPSEEQPVLTESGGEQ